MGLRLALTDYFPQQHLQAAHVVVLEHPDVRTTLPRTRSYGRVVMFIRDDKTTFAHQRRNDSRVSRESHGTNQRVLCAHESRDQRLRNLMKVTCSPF